MNRTRKAVIVGAAMAGLFTGAAARVHATTVVNGSAGTSINVMEDSDKHSCKGQNSCKGKGGCKTDSNSCKGQNACKGKGGCATDGSKKDDK